MSNKRSRPAGNSSTFFASHASLPDLESPSAEPTVKLQQPYNPKKVVKQSDGAGTIDESRRRIGVLSLSAPPVQEEVTADDGGHVLESVGGLSQRCFKCRKKFGPEMDIFMYRGLAFCGGACRDEQIKIDNRVAAKKS